ncbi:T9SS type A sorting domain-containing protein [Moheibacter sp.]|uniref:T9SS type A sorting domain-containing protein n=1 Tax=Moheibacter sp. TaxID=1965316 RepID=UPI003C71937E
MKKALYLFLLINSSFAISQISFNEMEVLNDRSYQVLDFMTYGDINNDGFPEMFFSGQSSNSLGFFWLLNDSGDYKSRSRMSQDAFKNKKMKYLFDVDKDGLLDIIGIAYNNKYYWLKNLGNNTFVNNWQFLVSYPIDYYSSDLFYDYNKDGYFDFFVTTSQGEVYRYTNQQGNGFSSPELVFYTDNTFLGNIRDIKFLDFNQDGHEDLLVRTFSTDFDLYLNNGNDYYQYHIPIENQANEYDLDSFDFDGNSLNDFVIYDENNLRIRTFFYDEDENEYFSQDVFIDNPFTHNSFGGTVKSHVIDFNQDGLEDILVTTGPGDNEYSNLYYYENIGNQEFAEKVLIVSSIQRLENVYIDDYNVDGLNDVFLVNNTNYFPNFKLLINEGNNDFKEVIVESFFKSSDKSFLLDFNNDGNIDIFNGKSGLLWYENYGNDEWSGRRFISSLDIDFKRKINYELIDINNDGLFDIISNETDGDFSIELEGNFFSVYQNLGNQEFEKIYSLDYDYLDHWEHYEVFKNNDELFPDVYFTKPLFDSEFSHELFYIKNNGGNFELPAQSTILPIGTIIKPLSDFKMTDLNNDGLPEVVYLDNDFDNQLYRLNYLENLGNNIFRREVLGTSSNYIGHQMFPVDYDSDGDQDIIIGNYKYGTREFSVYENDNMLFTKKLIDENAIVDDVLVHDINNDGLLDILTIAYYGWHEPEYEYQYVIFYYENQGNGQYEKHLIYQFDSYFNNDNTPDRGNIYLYDKNLDGELDLLVSCSDDYSTILFLLNTSNLEVEDLDGSINLTQVYPNPFSEVINWKSVSPKNNYNVLIFDLAGKKVFSNNLKQNHLDLNFLEKGIYILKIDNESFKVIKK